MALLGKLLQGGIKLGKSLIQDDATPIDLQKAVLRKLLLTAQDTDFGHQHYFKTVLTAFGAVDPDLFYRYYKSNVPIYDYETMDAKWWCQSRIGKENVTWPSRVEYYALSSGTSGASSKHIPVTTEMLKSMRKTGMRQFMALLQYNVEPKYLEADILMVGGSTNLKFNGHYYEGDLSGITTSKVPIWLRQFYKPGKVIAAAQNWDDKLNEIVLHADQWNIGVIVGVPAWIQILLEKIIAHYDLRTIHDLWPNLKFFVHGGVAFAPYKESFESLLATPLYYMETYLASEGFIAYQNTDRSGVMKMVLDNGIFFEFIPFNEENFDADGNLGTDHETFKIDQIKEGTPYALLLSTNAGAWRYLIGDVIEFTNAIAKEIIIVGRTKHFLSVCGEHLSLDNMTQAISMAAIDLGVTVREFCVSGEKYDTLFAHHWYVGVDDALDVEQFCSALDQHLKHLNDDYAVERAAALKSIRLDVVPTSRFYGWMASQGKLGGQHKFPRVLKGEVLDSWLQFLED